MTTYYATQTHFESTSKVQEILPLSIVKTGAYECGLKVNRDEIKILNVDDLYFSVNDVQSIAKCENLINLFRSDVMQMFANEYIEEMSIESFNKLLKEFFKDNTHGYGIHTWRWSKINPVLISNRLGITKTSNRENNQYISIVYHQLPEYIQKIGGEVFYAYLRKDMISEMNEKEPFAKPPKFANKWNGCFTIDYMSHKKEMVIMLWYDIPNGSTKCITRTIKVI